MIAGKMIQWTPAKFRIEDVFAALKERFGSTMEGSARNPNEVVRVPPGVARVRIGSHGTMTSAHPSRENSYSDIAVISRHVVSKDMYVVSVGTSDGVRTLATTDDHTCARLGDDGSVVFCRASELAVGDRVPVAGPGVSDVEGTVVSVSVETPGEGGIPVYDVEVASGRHVYYANGVLVHNSQFMNLGPITRAKCREAGISEDTRFSALPDGVRKAVVDDAYHILDLVNDNVRRLIDSTCHTTQGCVLHYALEYIASEGFYFKKKHYIVHKVIEDDKPCDKFKYSGISVKKAEIPASMKTFLKDIYESTMTTEWTESDYVKAVAEAYRKYLSLDWGDMAYYRKLRTPKGVVSLVESEKGAGAHARAANFYNGLLEELGLGGKYPKIAIGDEMRYSYVIPSNAYGQDVVAFKGVFPDEFRKAFRPDYNKMFEKIFTKSLQNYVEIMGYDTYNPTRSVEDPSFDIF